MAVFIINNSFQGLTTFWRRVTCSWTERCDKLNW